MESKHSKKTYNKPELIVHGNVEKVTKQFGSYMVDVPYGTPVADAGPGGVTGDPS